MAADQASLGQEIVQRGSQLWLHGFPVLGMPDEARAVKYFSLNPFLPGHRDRCPLECAYCVCHQDHEWHHHPERFAATADDTLIDLLIERIFATPEGASGFPISLCDYSDPFVPAHRGRVLYILEALIERGAASLIYITTKVHPGARFLRQLQAVLQRPHRLRPTVFVSLPPLKPGYEQVSVGGRARLIKDLVALGIPCCWYLRPLAEEWFDEALMWQLARELLPYVSHHVVLSGLVMSGEIAAILQERGLAVPRWDNATVGRKQPLAPAFERRVRAIISAVADEQGVNLGPVMGHRLCGTNGNHAYGCLLCAKQNRYCQLFQLHHYGSSVDAADHQQLRQLLNAQKLAMAGHLTSLAAAPAPTPSDRPPSHPPAIIEPGAV